MPRGKSEKTELQKAGDAARAAYKAAKEAADKSGKQPDKDRAAKAKDAMAVAMKAEARERWTKGGKARVNKVLQSLTVLGNCANLKYYGFQEPEVVKAFDAIAAKASAVRAKFDGALKGGGGISAAEEFAFE